MGYHDDWFITRQSVDLSALLASLVKRIVYAVAMVHPLMSDDS